MNAYWSMAELERFTPSEGILFAALVDLANKLFWKNTIAITNVRLADKISVSEKTMISARNKLKQKGLIDFKSGKRGSACKYQFPLFQKLHCKNYSTTVKVSDNVKVKVKDTKSVTETFRHNNTEYIILNTNTNNKENFSKNNFEEENSENENFEKPTEEKISKPPAETEISPSKKVAPKKVSKSSSTQKTQEAKVDALELPFESEEFRENWLGFRQVRKEMRKPVTPTAAKMIFKKLSKFGEKVATQALEASATNGWQGVFPDNIVREQNYSAPKNTNQIIKPDFINADYSDTTL
ncbi:hypothetical protein ACE193_21335 [Bernardetia sp. OM2101]|uniref:hypothetical protein n=1 Tax=Bernardetia sp. OM2101 TaxID=3344876 RepID=UPI0035D11E67